MAAQTVSGISSVQNIAAYGGTQSDVSSLEKQRNRLMMELDKVNAAQGSEMQTPYRRSSCSGKSGCWSPNSYRKAGVAPP